MQCAVIDGHVQDAVAKGAEVLCGAKHEKQFLLADGAQGGDARHASSEALRLCRF